MKEFRINEGSKNKMMRRKRQVDQRVRVNIPKASIRQTIGLVVRIHSGRHTAPEIKADLKALGLSKKYDAIFMQLDDNSLGIIIFLLSQI